MLIFRSILEAILQGVKFLTQAWNMNTRRGHNFFLTHAMFIGVQDHIVVYNNS